MALIIFFSAILIAWAIHSHTQALVEMHNARLKADTTMVDTLTKALEKKG